MKNAVTFIVFILIIGCTNHEVDTFPEWCEQISDVNLENKYGKAWAPIFSVSFKGDKIRDDFTTFLNTAYVEKTKNRANKIVWREGTILHIINISTLFVINPDTFISEWRNGIETAKSFSHTIAEDKCLYGTAASLFDAINIHTPEFDELGNITSGKVSEISTDRKTVLNNPI